MWGWTVIRIKIDIIHDVNLTYVEMDRSVPVTCHSILSKPHACEEWARLSVVWKLKIFNAGREYC